MIISPPPFFKVSTFKRRKFQYFAQGHVPRKVTEVPLAPELTRALG